ncbi:hypothetical protein, partial [Mycolicibacterium sp.]|uniref:hypothetical protein n=1 Tax=Mycolicibacterium sp. TaxID=2320850 RepID=UPI0037CA4AF0
PSPWQNQVTLVPSPWQTTPRSVSDRTGVRLVFGPSSQLDQNSVNDNNCGSERGGGEVPLNCVLGSILVRTRDQDFQAVVPGAVRSHQ